MKLLNLYDETELTSQEDRLKTAINSIKDAIRSSLTKEKSFLDTVELEFPHIGERQNPLECSSDFEPKNNKRRVVMPILSLVFFEDLCTAYAWLWAKNYSLETVDEYLTILKEDREYLVWLQQCFERLKEYNKCREMLRQTWASDFIDRRFPLPPLNALQIPKDALQDDNVEGLSRRFRNSGYAFILAHELGHLYHKHTDSNIINEIEADLFALQVMQRTSTIPMGMVLWFLATVYYFPTRGSFDSDKQWEEFVMNEITHPLNEERLLVLATRLNEYANDDDFTRFAQYPAADKEIIRFIADGILKIVSVLQDVDLQRYMITKARSSNVSSLAPRPQINLNDPSRFPSALEPLSPATIPPELTTLIAQMAKQRPNSMADIKRYLQRLATQSSGSGAQFSPTQGSINLPLSPNQPARISQLNSTYVGQANNTTMNTIVNITLTLVQNQEKISGFCSIALLFGGSGPFAGSIDTAGHIKFTIRANDGSGTITAAIGTLQPDGSLSGTYTSQNPASQGVWFARPV